MMAETTTNRRTAADSSQAAIGKGGKPSLLVIECPGASRGFRLEAGHHLERSGGHLDGFESRYSDPLESTEAPSLAQADPSFHTDRDSRTARPSSA